MCQVNVDSLRCSIQRREKSNKKQNLKKIQKFQNETQFIDIIKNKELNNKLYTRSMVIEEWKKISNKSENWCGNAWYGRFMKRYADVLSQRKAKTIEPFRVRYSLIDQCKRFNSKLNSLGIAKIPPHLILNVNESHVDSKSFET